jgi:hypothetical protein
MPIETIRQLVHDRIIADNRRLCIPSVLEGWETDGTLRNSVEKIVVSESGTLVACFSSNYLLTYPL